jgi:PKD repeat protein
MKSTDGGVTWQQVNTGMGNATVSKLLIHPLNHEILYAATSSGVYKTDNGGASWSNLSGGGNWKDMVFKPGDPMTIYAVTGAALHRTQDGGSTWTQLSTGSGGNRGVVAVTPANPEIVYFLVTNPETYKATYRSTNGGDSFTQMSTSPNIMGRDCTGGSAGQAWYNLCIAADPVNPDVILVGGINIFSSSNGGQNWEIVAHWTGDCSVDYVHADVHVFETNPLNDKLYAGCDGGCWHTSDMGSNWTYASQGLGISQIYKIGQSKTVSKLVMNGYQDNGTNLWSDTTWRHVSGGDGMECAIDPTNPKYRYSSIYYGSIYRLYNNNNNGLIGGSGVNGITEEGAWVSPFLIDNSNSNSMYLGLKNVWRSNNIKNGNVSGVTWTKITSHLPAGNCRVLRQSYIDPGLIYLVKEGQVFYRTDNAQASSPVWISLSSQLPGSSTPTAVETDPMHLDHVYITSGRKVYLSTDRGLSWTDISGTLPDVNLNTIVCANGPHSGLYVGSDIGVFYKDDLMNDWIPFTSGLPAAAKVTELEIFQDNLNPDNNRIRAATYGRGLWESMFYQAVPTADFYAGKTTMPTGCGIDFYDFSAGNPSTWQWTFPGGTPSSSTLPNPTGITYANAGNFDVQLIVTNSLGTDTLLIPAYITISNSLLPGADFYCNDSILCSGNNIVKFFDASEYCPTSWQWTVQPPTVSFMNGTTANSQNPEIQFSQDGNYTVSLIVGNVNGTSTLEKINYIVVGGLLPPFTDGFEYSDIQGKGWTLDNPNDDFSWITTQTGGLANSTRSAESPIYATNSFGYRDRLISPVMNLSSYSHAMLHFRHAYAQYDVNYTDTLFVYASEDCGLSWTKVYSGFEDGSGIFATHPATTSSFVPFSSDDWCGGSFGPDCREVNLDAWAGKKNVRIAFESVSTTSNNIFLDDILVDDAVGIEDFSKSQNVRIYPNPSEGVFFVEIEDMKSDARIDVISPISQTVFQQELNASPGSKLVRIDLSKLPGGLYYLTLTDKEGRSVFKLALQ